MSPEADRIQVPTNGKGPHPVDEPPPIDESPPPDQATAAFTPTQLAVGFGILASLVLLVARRMRRNRSSGRGFGRR